MTKAKTTKTVRETKPLAAKKRASAAPEEGLRQSRQRRVHAELVAAGTALFHDKGFVATTINDIADRAGISRRTFFRYFKAKDDLVFKWMDEQGEFVLPMLASRPASEAPLKAMEYTFIALAEHHDSEPERVRLLTKLIFDTPALGGRYHEEHAKWEGEFVRILKRGRPAAAAKVFALQVQVASTITAFVVAIRYWAHGRHRTPLKPWVEAAFAAHEEGVVGLGD